MAVNFGQMTQQILTETYRDDSFSTQVQNAIVSAIKELEIEQLFINETYAAVPLITGTNTALLPNDFISMLMVNLVYPQDPPQQYGETILNQSTGFENCTFYELMTYRYQTMTPGTPGKWALYQGLFYVYPWADTDYIINMYYYRRDGSYPVSPEDVSIWFGDFTQDVTRYKARGIFYRDSLQSPELAASDFEKANIALSQLRLRNSQRSTINTLSL